MFTMNGSASDRKGYGGEWIIRPEERTDTTLHTDRKSVV